MEKKKSVLITGATGFSGKYHIQAALKENYQVIGIGRNIEKLLALQKKIDFIGLHCDLSSKKSDINDIIQEFKPKFIIHLAAKATAHGGNPSETLINNALSTISLLEAVRLHSQGSRVLVTSSAAIYKNTLGRKKENSEIESANVYAASKICDQIYSDAYVRQFNLDIMAAIVYNHNGPGRMNSLHSDIVRATVEAKKSRKKYVDLTIPSLEYARDIQHIQNWTESSLTILEKGLTGESYNICSGIDTTLKDFILELEKQTQVRINIKEDPAIVNFGPNIVSGGDNTKLRNLGWQPSLDLADLIADLISFFEK